MKEKKGKEKKTENSEKKEDKAKANEMTRETNTE